MRCTAAVDFEGSISGGYLYLNAGGRVSGNGGVDSDG
jgi:hypothetical protein